MKKKLSRLSLASLVLVSSCLGLLGCATSPSFTYDITIPEAVPGDILQACSPDTTMDYVMFTDPFESCPVGTFSWGVVFSNSFAVDFFDYVESLEIRNKNCQ